MEDGNEDVNEQPEETENVENRTGEEGDEEPEGLQKRQQEPKKKKACNLRIDELSTPNKRMFLALWNEHAYHLPKDKVKNLKLLLQRLYAMSPEETAQYFAELREEAKVSAARRKLKQKLRKYLQEKQNEKQRQRAYRLFKKLLKCGITYAAQNPIPRVISVRLRYLSDIILEQICELRRVEYPNREHPDQIGSFLISVADWMAIAVERLYFAAQMSINEMLNQQKAPLEETLPSPQGYRRFHPPGSSTPERLLSLDLQETLQTSQFDDFQPKGASTPQRLSLNLPDQTLGLPTQFPNITAPPAASSPRRFSISQNETSYKLAELSLPCFSFKEASGKVINPQQESPKQLPFFTTDHLTSANNTLDNKTNFTMPLNITKKTSNDTKESQNMGRNYVRRRGH